MRSWKQNQTKSNIRQGDGYVYLKTVGVNGGHNPESTTYYNFTAAMKIMREVRLKLA